MVAFRPNKTNEHQKRNTKTRNEDYDVDLHVSLWEDPHEMTTLPEFHTNADECRGQFLFKAPCLLCMMSWSQNCYAWVISRFYFNSAVIKHGSKLQRQCRIPSHIWQTHVATMANAPVRLYLVTAAMKCVCIDYRQTVRESKAKRKKKKTHSQNAYRHPCLTRGCVLCCPPCKGRVGVGVAKSLRVLSTM